jgi:DNA-binding MarR family transcriptional regulator
MVSAPLTAFQPDAPSKDRLRLWIRLLRASRSIEAELRERLKTEFGSTLPRFLLVSNGNVTGIVERLVADGLVARSKRDGDRRASIVRLTELGTETFARMAAAHEGWVDALLGGVGREEARHLAEMLKSFRSEWEE